MPDPVASCQTTRMGTAAIQRAQFLSFGKDSVVFHEDDFRLKDWISLKSVDILHWGPMMYWYTYVAGHSLTWPCDPALVKVTQETTGEVLDYDRDKEMVASGRRPYWTLRPPQAGSQL